MLSVIELAQLLTGALDGKFNVSRIFIMNHGKNENSRKKKEKMSQKK